MALLRQGDDGLNGQPSTLNEIRNVGSFGKASEGARKGELRSNVVRPTFDQRMSVVLRLGIVFDSGSDPELTCDN